LIDIKAITQSNMELLSTYRI